jgi:hypothetical protein
MVALLIGRERHETGYKESLCNVLSVVSSKMHLWKPQPMMEWCLAQGSFGGDWVTRVEPL